MNDNRLRSPMLFLLFLGLLAVVLTLPSETNAGIYDEDGEVTYKEYWVPHSDYTGGCGDSEKPYGNSWYIEPWGCDKTLTFQIPDDFSGAKRAEIYIDLWRNQDGKLARFSLNGGPPQKPNVGSDWSRTPYVGPIPLEDLQIGLNSITFSGGGYHVHDVAFRIYYDDAKPLIAGPGSDVTPPDGELLSVKADGPEVAAGAGGTLQADNNQLTLKADVSGAKYVEFHGYYFGFDEDNDGQMRDWHNRNRNNWNPGGTDPQPNGGTIDHAGTVATPSAGEYSVNWDVSSIPDQDGMQFKIRLVDDAGNVREVVGNGVFTLTRAKPLVAFWAPQFVDAPLWMEGTKPATQNRPFLMPSDFEATDYESGKMIHSFWNRAIITFNDGDNSLWPQFSGDDHWQMSITPINQEMLWPGPNKITYTYNNPGEGRPGAFVEKPGPMFILERKAWAFDNTAPTLFNRYPAPEDTGVSAGTNIQVQIVDAQSGLDYSTLNMTVQEQSVTPTITGALNSAFLVYRPTVGFEENEEVTVNIEGCDLDANCFNTTYSFKIEGESIPTGIVSDDFNVCELDETTWEWRDPIGDSSYSVNGAQLSLSVPAGTNHDLWQDANDAPRIMQPANDADLRIKAKFDSLMNQGTQMQGVLIAQDDQNYLRIGMRHDGTNVLVEAYAFEEGVPSPRGSMMLVDEPLPSTILVQRFGNRWEYFYLDQYDEWINVRNFDHSLNVSEVGVFAGNHGNPASAAPEFTSLVDFFFDDNAPIDPEDKEPLILPVEVIGQGTVEKSPLCGNPVTLTANPAEGYFFDGWSSLTGFISGRQNPLTTEFVADEKVTATFRIDALTLEVEVLNNGTGTGGTVDVSPEKAIYNFGDEVTLTPEAPIGWDFKGWAGDVDEGDVYDNPLVITMEDNLNITATFEAKAVTLAVDVVGDGSVNLNPDKAGNYQYGDVVTLSADPAFGWGFDRWQGVDAASTFNNPLNLVVTEDTEVTAVFIERPPYVFFPFVLSGE